MIQIDMDMPKTCSDCCLFHEGYCSASVDEWGCDVDIFNSKPDWCPLKEVKHGKPDGKEYPQSTLNQSLEAFRTVYDSMIKKDCFSGEYDAREGSPSFMNGVLAVMNYIAYAAGGEDLSREFIRMFLNNIEKCEKGPRKHYEIRTPVCIDAKFLKVCDSCPWLDLECCSLPYEVDEEKTVHEITCSKYEFCSRIVERMKEIEGE